MNTVFVLLCKYNSLPQGRMPSELKLMKRLSNPFPNMHYQIMRSLKDGLRISVVRQSYGEKYPTCFGQNTKNKKPQKYLTKQKTHTNFRWFIIQVQQTHTHSAHINRFIIIWCLVKIRLTNTCAYSHRASSSHFPRVLN